jgi:3-oxoacyl-[acyl-carrier protein] reductase
MTLHDATAIRLQGFSGRTAVVTGAARGIGRRVAETIAAQGAATVGLDLRAPVIEGVRGLDCDVTSAESVDLAFGQVEDELGTISVLVLNAGILVVEPFEQTTLASWRRTMQVNLDSAFLCVHRAITPMRSQRYGRILAIGSSAGITGGKRNAAAYGASKAGIMTFAKAIAAEFASDGITANALAPALIRTPMIADYPDMVAQVPVGRYGEPDDVAAIAAFLCSEHASYITGEVIDVNGGFLID